MAMRFGFRGALLALLLGVLALTGLLVVGTANYNARFALAGDPPARVLAARTRT